MVVFWSEPEIPQQKIKIMKFYSTIRVRFSDIDAMGHVNNATYFNYTEEARIDYFKKIIGERHNWQKFGVLLAHNEIDYFKPVHLGDELSCGIETVKMGEKSIHCNFEFRVKTEVGDYSVVSKGKFSLVCFDNLKKTSAPVPDLWRQKFTEFEKI